MDGTAHTYYISTLKGVGRIYRQSYIDTYAKVVQAKLYATKTPITAADFPLFHQKRHRPYRIC